MIKWLLMIFLGIQLLCSGVAWSEEGASAPAPDTTSSSADTDVDNQFLESLVDLKNPFLPPPVPKPPAPPVVVVPPTPTVVHAPVKPPVVHGPPPLPKPVDISALRLSLSGIVWGAVPQAIIDEQIVSVGDTVEGGKITAISQKGVEILYKGTKINVSMDEGIKRENTPTPKKQPTKKAKAKHAKRRKT
jgi:hypothetical protein